MLKPTILHVEDDPNDLVLFRHACDQADVALDVRIACDGDEAIAYLSGQAPFSNRAQFPLPALVLLDLKMPRVNGFEVLAWIREQPPFMRLPVVVFSSSNHEVDVQRAYDAGANSYLVKPADFNSLVQLVKLLSAYWLHFNESVPPPVLTAVRAETARHSFALSM